jgi:hypothetical protein
MLFNYENINAQGYCNKSVNGRLIPSATYARAIAGEALIGKDGDMYRWPLSFVGWHYADRESREWN